MSPSRELRRLLIAAAIGALGALCYAVPHTVGDGLMADGAHQAVDSGLRAASTSAPTRLWNNTRPTLVVFGYAGCGDVCPQTLRALTRNVGSLSAPFAPRILFVDVDATESPRTVERYVEHIGAIEAAVGDARAVAAAEQSVGAAIATDVSRHDGRTFVLNEQGVLVGTVPPGLDDAHMRLRLAQLLSAARDAALPER